MVSNRALNCSVASVLCKTGYTFFLGGEKETNLFPTFSQKVGRRRVDSKDLRKRENLYMSEVPMGKRELEGFPHRSSCLFGGFSYFRFWE